MTPAISVTGLTRRYHGQLALNGVNLDFEPDSITGLLGRNGAGKTTLLPSSPAMSSPRPARWPWTALLALTLAAVYALGLTVLQLIERGTGGWGLNLHFFRVPYLLAGPWYLSWLTSFVGLALMFAWGMWFGIVYRRWNLAGLLSFIAVQALALTAVLVIVGVANQWRAVAHFFTTLTIEGLTGLLAALTVALLAGGYATVRRLAV